MKETPDGAEIRLFEPQHTASVRVKTTLNKMTPKVTQLLNETAEFLQSQGISPMGPGFGIYHEVGRHGFLVDVEVGYPVDLAIVGNGRVLPGSLPGGKAVVVAYKGPHGNIAAAHQAAQSWMARHGIDFVAAAREVFLTDLRRIDEGEVCEAEAIWPIAAETPTSAGAR
jgi:effector-binding domain-containing protein